MTSPPFCVVSLPQGVKKVIVGEEEQQEDLGIKEEEEEVDITEFLFSSTAVKSDEDEEKPRRSQLPHSEKDSGGPEADLQLDEKNSVCSGTDVSAGDCEESSKCSADFTSEDNNAAADDVRCDSGEGSYICIECGKAFKRMAHLVVHKRSHTGEKPFICPKCGKRFVQSGGLSKHMWTHKVEKPFSCSECGRCFIEKTALMNHLTTHTGVKPHSCPECSKTFSCRSALNAHMKIHSGEKNFTCNVCLKKFTWNFQLNRHKCANSKPARNRVLMPRPQSDRLVFLVQLKPQ
ncbi:uncharacterized protein KZ484_015923 isoform 2-T2 [Pholidichthys leucotaenia]